MRVMFFEVETPFEAESPITPLFEVELEFLPDETCAECGEVVYGGQMPRHFAKDHAREDEMVVEISDYDLTSSYRVGILRVSRPTSFPTFSWES